MSRSPDAPPHRAPDVARGDGLAAALEPRAPRILRAVLGAALAALVALLVLSTKPWDLPGGPGLFTDPHGRSLRTTVMLGLWWAALVNAVLCAVLLATLRAWARPLPAAVTAPGRAVGARIRRRRRAFALGVLLAMALALGLRLPLAQKSLWWDEGWTVRQVIVGWWYVPSDGTVEDRHFREGGLARALWYWKKPTNHVFYSVASWTSLAAWRTATGAPRARSTSSPTALRRSRPRCSRSW